MNEQRILLRASYWVAAIVDFASAILVMIPERMGVTGFVYPMSLMSAVAFSWAVCRDQRRRQHLNGTNAPPDRYLPRARGRDG